MDSESPKRIGIKVDSVNYEKEYKQSAQTSNKTETNRINGCLIGIPYRDRIRNLFDSVDGFTQFCGIVYL